MFERILVVLPHPDDEAFGMSGTLAKFISEGAYVTYACLTLGQMGRALGKPPVANRLTLPSLRQQELIESCKAIGIQDLRMLGYHDKTIEFEPKDELDSVISELIEDVKPNLVLTFFPDYSVHPDHDATGASVIRVLEGIPAEQRPETWCVGFAHNMVADNGEPDVEVDISDFLENKYQSLAAHSTQFQISEMFGDADIKSAEVKERFGKERFWKYKFEK